MLAVYSLSTNEPRLLQDRDLWYPNLAEDVRSGIPMDLKDDQAEYIMFHADGKISFYDFDEREVTQTTRVDQFLNC